VLHAKALPSNPYDDYTLVTVIDATEKLTSCPIERAYLDKLACAAVVAVNVSRLSLMTTDMHHFEMVHNQWGGGRRFTRTCRCGPLLPISTGHAFCARSNLNTRPTAQSSLSLRQRVAMPSDCHGTNSYRPRDAFNSKASSAGSTARRSKVLRGRDDEEHLTAELARQYGPYGYRTVAAPSSPNQRRRRAGLGRAGEEPVVIF
jgi:hypothetical protein